MTRAAARVALRRTVTTVATRGRRDMEPPSVWYFSIIGAAEFDLARANSGTPPSRRLDRRRRAAVRERGRDARGPSAAQNLPRRAATAGDRAGDGAGLIARGLAGEKERARHRPGQRAVGLAAADAGVAVRAAAEGVGLPVVRVRGVELRGDAPPRHAENRGERSDAALDHIALGQQP